MTNEPKVTQRVIRYQFRRGGLIHLARTNRFEYPDGTEHNAHPHNTVCGLNIPVGQGGWGYGGKVCPKCDKWAQPRGVLDQDGEES